MLFYRNILSQNWFTKLPCCFIVTFCPKICSPTYHDVLPKHFVTKLVHQPTMLFYRNIFVTKFVHLLTMLFYRNLFSQNLFSYLPCCFLSKHFLTKLVHQPTMLFYRNILSHNLFTYLPCGFIKTFFHKICSLTYHAVLS